MEHREQHCSAVAPHWAAISAWLGWVLDTEKMFAHRHLPGGQGPLCSRWPTHWGNLPGMGFYLLALASAVLKETGPGCGSVGTWPDTARSSVFSVLLLSKVPRVFPRSSKKWSEITSSFHTGHKPAFKSQWFSVTTACWLYLNQWTRGERLQKCDYQSLETFSP